MEKGAIKVDMEMPLPNSPEAHKIFSRGRLLSGQNLDLVFLHHVTRSELCIPSSQEVGSVQ